MTARNELTRQAEERAAGRCEYCRMHQSLQGATFHLEHVLPSSLGGETILANLAWACPGCNLRKADRVEILDPVAGIVIPPFNPRRDDWSAHFRFEGYQLIGLSAVGRATVVALDLNHPRRLLIRQAEELFGLFN